MVNLPTQPDAASRALAESPNTLQFLQPLQVLDTFLQDLQRCEQGSHQLRLLLQALADSLRADAVFLQSISANDMFELAGPMPLSQAWCRRFLEGLLAGTTADESHLVRSHLRGGGDSASPVPVSVALVQLSKSRKTWVVALSCTPGRHFQLLDVKLMVLARRLLVTQSRQVRTAQKLKETLLGLIHCLTATIDAKDPYTCGHSERVARIAVRIGQTMKLPEALLSDVYLAGLLHDIGKIGIRDSVLLKQGKLAEEEWKHMQEHPVIGDRIISTIGQLAHVRPGVRNHHERFDGKGYPDQLAGPEIPLLARLLAVADSCDAMMAARPYRPAMPPHRLETIMTQGAGSQWDPHVVAHFMACRQDLYGICQRGIGESLCLAVDHAVNGELETSWARSISANLFRDDSRPTPLTR
jgi:HD-GYP domain-containing protein (c-di-GMP phosphodiesterase class II)